VFWEGIPDALSQGPVESCRSARPKLPMPCNALSGDSEENALHLSKSRVRQGQNLG
jgi:hypothetical protein